MPPFVYRVLFPAALIAYKAVMEGELSPVVFYLLAGATLIAECVVAIRKDRPDRKEELISGLLLLGFAVLFLAFDHWQMSVFFASLALLPPAVAEAVRRCRTWYVYETPAGEPAATGDPPSGAPIVHRSVESERETGSP